VHQGLIHLSYFSYILDKADSTGEELRRHGACTREQKARIEEIRAVGGIAQVVRSLEDVHRLFGKDGEIEIL
jgi:hypothetical protein